MTGKEIKDYAESYLDEQIDDVDALRAINRALNLLGDTALVNDTQEYDNVAANVWLDLPADLINVVFVEEGASTKFTDYEVLNLKIRFKKSGSYKVYYRRLPRPIDSIFDTPEIHPAYHQCLVTYLSGWWRIKDDDESPDGLKNEQKFVEDSIRVFNQLRRNKRGPSTIEVFRHA